VIYWLIALVLYCAACYRTWRCYYYYHPERLLKHSPHLFDPTPLSVITSQTSPHTWVYLSGPGTVTYVGFSQE